MFVTTIGELPDVVAHAAGAADLVVIGRAARAGLVTSMSEPIVLQVLGTTIRLPAADVQVALDGVPLGEISTAEIIREEREARDPAGAVTRRH